MLKANVKDDIRPKKPKINLNSKTKGLAKTIN